MDRRAVILGALAAVAAGPGVAGAPARPAPPQAVSIFMVYPDGKGEWRWRLTGRGDRLIAKSAQGYKNKTDCLNSAPAVRSACNLIVVQTTIERVAGAGIRRAPSTMLRSRSIKCSVR